MNNLMRVLQMPALGITHAAHSAVIKTPDFPQDSSPCLADKKVTHTCRNFSLFTSGEEDYFLDKLNETMTTLSSEERQERKTERKQRGEENKRRGGFEGEGDCFLIHIFLFLSLSPSVAASNANPAFKSRQKH